MNPHSACAAANPSQYLYYHIVFDEVCYEMLMNRPPSGSDRGAGGLPMTEYRVQTAASPPV